MRTLFSKLMLVAFMILFAMPQSAISKSKAKHVILIGLDGWGSYGLEQADMPNVKKLMSEGAYTLKKRSTLPSSSAINWASMFMGVGPELHGYTEWGSRTPEIPSREVNLHGIFPTIFQLLRDAKPGAEIGCLHEWKGIKYLVDTLSLNYHHKALDYKKDSTELYQVAVSYIKEKKPNLVAICFDNPDHVGHQSGHNSPAYYRKLKELDDYIGYIIEATQAAGMEKETIFIITSDHGGIKNGHGGKSLNEMETPFIISGKNIRKGVKITDSMMQFDVASTIAAIFDLKQPQVWIGRPMKQAFK